MNRGTRRSLHPAGLLAGALIFLICLIASAEFTKVIYLFLLWLVVIIALKVRIFRIAKEIITLWPFLALTLLLHLFLSTDSALAWRRFRPENWGDLQVAQALLFTGRLALIMSVGVALFQLNSPQRYGQEIGRLLGKFFRRHRSFGQAELVITLALRLVPLLRQESRQLRLAMAARGNPVSKTMSARLRSERKLLFPLVINAFRRADHVALALEARGWDPLVSRTAMNSPKSSVVDQMGTLAFGIACCLVFFL